MDRIDIKLDRKKWGSILDRLSMETPSKNYPELVKRILFFTYLFLYEKIPSIDNKTWARHILEKRNISISEAHHDFLRKFVDFEKHSKLPPTVLTHK
jgi:hypothetical protein